MYMQCTIETKNSRLIRLNFVRTMQV